jgi:probable F420-dependent oxidoreductase
VSRQVDPNVKIDSTIGSLDRAGEQAVAAERVGYDGVWSSEVNRDPFLPLALAAASTEHVELGTSIAVAFARSPMALAYTANDLQGFSHGRMILGLGSQVKAHVVRRFSMPWGSPAAQMREFILAMRSAWSCWQDGADLDVRGTYYQHSLMTPNFVPPKHEYGPPRVFLAGVGDLMTRVAGEVADGFLAHGFTTPRWFHDHTIPALESGRARVGLPLAGFEVKISPFVASGTEEEIEAAVRGLRSQIAFYGSTPAYRPVLALHGWEDLATELTSLSREGKWNDMATLIDDDVLDAFAIVASPDDVPAEIAERYGSFITRMSYAPPASVGPEEAANLFEKIRSIPSLGSSPERST